MEKIAVIGLGYVGLPVAIAFAEVFENTIAYDINSKRVDELRAANDKNGDFPHDSLEKRSTIFTSDPSKLSDCTFYIVAVPTPIDNECKPDLGPITRACEMIGAYLCKGDLVVLESTVYPGVTEEICGTVLARVSGLDAGKDFFLGYSPERINPGDKEHNFANITKVVAGQNQTVLERMTRIYGLVVQAGLHVAPNIKVAEAAKVLENTQRDLNVALMNELAVICDKLEISTSEVLEAAKTKWNFIPFTPGLVGGHCIGVDPYYLTTRAEQLGYVPQVILAGRRINDSMGGYIASKLVDLLDKNGKVLKNARIGIFGLSFKENVSDLRNSRVEDIISLLRGRGAKILIHDPFVDSLEAEEKFGLKLNDFDDMQELDGLVLAVPHRTYLDISVKAFVSFLAADGVFIDIKAAIEKAQIPEGVIYWSL